MKAFTADCPKDDRYSRAETQVIYHLPQLECKKCESDWQKLGRVPPTNPSPWLEWEIWYPAFALGKAADKTKFTDEKIVTLAELNALRKQVLGKGARMSQLPPGSGIGPVHARLPKRATDFVWSGFKLMASERALATLTDNGIRLSYGPVISIDTKQNTSYFAIQLEPTPLYSEQTLREMTFQFCVECGQCWMRDVKAKPKGPRQYLKKRFPDKQGLARAAEGLEILATDAFIDVVRSQKLTGMDFQEFGIYV